MRDIDKKQTNKEAIELKKNKQKKSIFFLWWELLRPIYFRDFQISNTVLLTIIIMLYIISLGFIYFITGSLHILLEEVCNYTVMIVN